MPDRELRVALRKFPYPYRAALTVCNDVDGVTPDDFLRIHQFLNTTQPTPWGRGLGLDVGDSFWMYAAGPEPERRLAYFAGLTSVESRWAPMLRDFIRAGYIDCLHTYGDFNHYGGFHRALAETAIQALQAHGLQLHVWTNHGDAHNFQGIGTGQTLGDVPQSRSANGDVFPSVEYHWDLTRALGIQFVWRNMDLTDVWGQERPLRLSDARDWTRFRHPRTAWRWFRRHTGAGPGRGNRLLEATRAGDGSAYYAFRRYGDFAQDRADDLAEALSAAHLAALIRHEAVAILYTHLGKRRQPTGPVIPLATQEGLRRLAEAARAGEIWVTTTARLLRYHRARQEARYTATEAAQQVRITVQPPLTARDLAGCTFEVESPKPVVLQAGSDELALRGQPAGRGGQTSWSVPWEPLSPGPLERHFSAHE